MIVVSEDASGSPGRVRIPLSFGYIGWCETRVECVRRSGDEKQLWVVDPQHHRRVKGQNVRWEMFNTAIKQLAIILGFRMRGLHFGGYYTFYIYKLSIKPLQSPFPDLDFKWLPSGVPLIVFRRRHGSLASILEI